MRILPLAFALLCCAPADPHAYCARQPQCRTHEPTMVCVDAAFEDREPVLQAVRMWATVLCDTRTFAVQVIDGAAPIPAQCRYTVLAVLSSYPWVQQRPENSVAFADPARGLAWIVEPTPEVIAHELGHLLGADHATLTRHAATCVSHGSAVQAACAQCDKR